MSLKFHPLADIFPLMEGAEFDALVADIKAHGLREKIDLYQGEIVEGRNRYRALQRLGIDPSADPGKYFRKAIYAHTVGGEIAPHEQNNDDRVRAYVISKNIHRRHLTPEQKRDLIAKVIAAKPEASDRRIAKQVKADHKTVGAIRRAKESTGEVSPVAKRVGADGKARKQPAKKKTAPTKTIPSQVQRELEAKDAHIDELETAREHDKDLAEKLRAAESKIIGLESEIEDLKGPRETNPDKDIVKEAFDLVLRMNDEQRAKFFDLYLERYGNEKYRGKYAEAAALMEADRLVEATPKRGRGRPPGSKNKLKPPPAEAVDTATNTAAA